MEPSEPTAPSEPMEPTAPAAAMEVDLSADRREATGR